MALSPIKMNVNAAPVEPADNQRLLGITADGELVQVEVDLKVSGVPSGTQGQLVGYDAQGNPVAVPAPTVSDPYDDSELVQVISAQGQRLEAAEQALGNLPAPVDIAPIAARLDTVEQGLPGLANRVGALEDAFAGLPEPVDLAPLTNRVAAVEEGLAAVAQPYDDTELRSGVSALETAYADAAARLAAAEALLADLPEGVDLGPIQTEIAQLKARLDAIDGFVNRPPTSSPIPPQALTIGVPFAADFSGYFDDPDGHTLNAAEVSGALPPGITQDGFRFEGTPTQTGTFTVTLVASDLYGAQASRTIAWTVAAVPVTGASFIPTPGGFTVQNPGAFSETIFTPTQGGFTVETANA
ncbi:Ig domain-containing protein [Paracoccus sp. SY]|uniref:Ig domain-containing protein n=1 Tax=Paracoccus sp. SY TaxID=1330255 RepID=UPI000CD308A5|nr:Ig domain-containing protein [Paracoccus sp. SY]